MSYDRLSTGLDGQRRTDFLSLVLQPHNNDVAVNQEASTSLVTAQTEIYWNKKICFHPGPYSRDATKKNEIRVKEIITALATHMRLWGLGEGEKWGKGGGEGRGRGEWRGEGYYLSLPSTLFLIGGRFKRQQRCTEH